MFNISGHKGNANQNHMVSNKNTNNMFTPIILATQEAEIRRIAVQSQPGQIVCETLSRKYPA
jgi:hypothetical protein